MHEMSSVTCPATISAALTVNDAADPMITPSKNP